jgi:hypothetical protein
MPKNGELTNYELEQQDLIDNACYELITQFCPNGLKDVEWNIQHISKIREALQEVIVDDMKLMTEQEFYPYIELEPEGNIILEPSNLEPESDEMIVTDAQLVTAMKNEVENIDAEQLAQWAGDALGGLCWYLNDGTYSFIPDVNYYGALDFTKSSGN